MPDLHGWITQQIDETEDGARAATAGPWTALDPDGAHGWTIGVVPHHPGIGIAHLPGRSTAGSDAAHIVRHDPAAVLRRCEADRRILNRHRLDPTVHWTPACAGCGDYGDLAMPYTENLNECPELLDLGYAHGLTPEILASLDQPVPPPMPERPEPRAFRLGPPARPTSSVPPTLRGPNWKPGP